MIELTEQQQMAVDTESAPQVVDPRTNKAYVLVGADVYNRVKGLIVDDAELDMEQVAALVEVAMADDDAGDPTLEYYQRTYGRLKALKDTLGLI